MRFQSLCSLLSVIFLLLPVTTQAHSGGTDANGCHTNTKTGDFHCHQSPESTKTQAKTTAKLQAKTGETLCIADIYNCSDFSTHQEAQAAFKLCLESTGKDIHRLDADNDQSACETLP